MNYIIRQNELSEEIKRKIFQGFSQSAIHETGIDGLGEMVSFEIYNNSEFIGACVVQLFWEQLHIKYLYVEPKYRGQGIARQLMDHALDYGKKLGCQFAFVETMSFQAPEFYKKAGFFVEFTRAGYARNTTFHYLKRSLNGSEYQRKVTRTGVYGVAKKDGKMLLVVQNSGPHIGKFDFPGGGIEFGESAEEALRREFAEEVGYDFNSFQLLDNLTATIDVPKSATKDSYVFYQIGMIYEVKGLYALPSPATEDIQHSWIDIDILTEEECSTLLWKYIQGKGF